METIKEEKKADLEQLLNSLIEKGWKPFGKRNKLYAVEDGVYILGRIASDWNTYDLRQLVSKESGLWQYVCENRMTKKMEKNPRGIWINSWSKSAYEKYPVYTMEKAEYRLIESALKDESELEDFLLSNIVIKDEKK